ncbi:hypothetical protein H9X96_00105 [Pedobacter sp. N36a]|uniref:hypothetical protein n=1 Tax=Pedobacter sp. N36a TaxID=2767996 RepID=UPI001656A7AF|nr:hypothetical protein [Pedobacter sp. N36a]MBC8984173.1 hypothetical protein [Pedobacter sp. N36a]
MLQRERSGKRSLWKYLWLMPLLSSLLFFSSTIQGAKSISGIVGNRTEKTASAVLRKENNGELKKLLIKGGC